MKWKVELQQCVIRDATIEVEALDETEACAAACEEWGTADWHNITQNVEVMNATEFPHDVCYEGCGCRIHTEEARREEENRK